MERPIIKHEGFLTYLTPFKLLLTFT